MTQPELGVLPSGHLHCFLTEDDSDADQITGQVPPVPVVFLAGENKPNIQPCMIMEMIRAIRSNMPDPIPIIVLGRLAVDQQ
jgi:hypothetical protein